PLLPRAVSHLVTPVLAGREGSPRSDHRDRSKTARGGSGPRLGKSCGFREAASASAGVGQSGAGTTGDVACQPGGGGECARLDGGGRSHRGPCLQPGEWAANTDPLSTNATCQPEKTENWTAIRWPPTRTLGVRVGLAATRVSNWRNPDRQVLAKCWG